LASCYYNLLLLLNETYYSGIKFYFKELTLQIDGHHLYVRRQCRTRHLDYATRRQCIVTVWTAWYRLCICTM